MERVCFFLPIKAVDNFFAENVYTNHSQRKMAFPRQTLGDDSASSFRCFCLCQSAQMIFMQVKTTAYQGNPPNYLVYAPPSEPFVPSVCLYFAIALLYKVFFQVNMGHHFIESIQLHHLFQ